jgi:DNA-binding transcriptional LysR family regulator
MCRPILPEVRVVPLETADAVKSAVASGLGAALIPLSAIEGDPSVTVLGELAGQPARSAVYVIHRRGALLPPQARSLVGFLLASSRRRRSELLTA